MGHPVTVRRAQAMHLRIESWSVANVLTEVGRFNAVTALDGHSTRQTNNSRVSTNVRLAFLAHSTIWAVHC